VLADLADTPFMAPEAGRLRELGLDPRAWSADSLTPGRRQ